MKRRDFIKGLVSLPLIGHVGILSSPDGISLFSMPHSFTRLSTVDELTMAMESMIKIGDGKDSMPYPQHVMYRLGTVKEKYIPRVLQMHLRTFQEQCRKFPEGKLYWRAKPALEKTDRGYEVYTRYSIA